MGIAPPVCSAMRAMMRVLMSVSAAPESPPSSFASACVHRVAADGGVGGDDAVQPRLHDHVHRRQQLVVGEIGREFDQHRHLFARAPGDLIPAGRDPAQKGAQKAALLELAQPGRVGRRNVHRQVVGQRCEDIDQLFVVLRRVVERGGLLLADVGADDWPARFAAAQLPGCKCRALAGKTHPVDDRPLLDQPEDPRLRVARLRFRRHGADFDMAETETREPTPPLAVLVVAGSQPDPVGKSQPEGLDRFGIGHREHRGHRRPQTRHPADPRDRSERKPVRRLGVEAEEHRTGKWIKDCHQSSIIRILGGIGDGRRGAIRCRWSFGNRPERIEMKMMLDV